MTTAASALRPRVTRMLRGGVDLWNQIGEQTAFYVKTIGFIPQAVGRYTRETLRLIAQMALGVGALAAIGGTVVIVSFLTFNTGSLVGIQVYRSLSDIGVQALEGFGSAFINTRIASPLIASIGLAATIGAGATAELGAMRINEEIDALEAMSIRSVAYLVSTRVVAGVVVVIPLFALAAESGFFATRVISVLIYGQSSGVYDHYFHTFLQPTDLFYSLAQVIAQGTVIMLVHTYYGYNASGGPAGVGEATGRAVRTSLIVAVTITLVVALGAYGASGNFHLSG